MGDQRVPCRYQNRRSYMPLSPFALGLDTLPLFFRYRDVVFGRGFAATVETTGRAICIREGDEYVMAGVEPGGMAVSGPSAEAAGAEFRRMFTTVLFDLAAEAPTFQDFSDAVESFVHETSPATIAEWEQAVAAARRLVQPRSDIAKQPAQLPATVAIVHTELAPTQNVISEPQHLVAA